MRRRWRSIALVSLAAIAFLEGGTRWLFSSETFFALGDRSADPIWRRAWVERLHGADIRYNFDVYHPTRGWALAPNLRDIGAFGPASLSSNSLGMRGRAEFTLAPSARPRLIALGDSFTFGEGVRDEEAWPIRLQEHLTGSEVMNLGAHGYGHDQMLLYFIEQGMRHRPDLVLVGFVRDDMVRNLSEFRDSAKPRMVTTRDGLEVRNVPVPTAAQALRRHRLGPRLLDFSIMLREGVRWLVGSNDRRMREVTSAILDSLEEKVSEAGGVMVLVYLPHGEELAVPDFAPPEERFFAEYCRSRATFCVDLRPLFLERIAAGYQVETAGPWLAGGHTLVAEGIARYLRERELLRRSRREP